MNTWEPVTILNSLMDGAEASASSVAWGRMAWLRAEARVHAKVPAIVGTLSGGRGARLYCIQPDRTALKLTPTQRVTPVFIPNWQAVAATSAHGWIWLLSDKPNPPPTN